MEKDTEIKQQVESSYLSIDFVNRYLNLSADYNDYQNAMPRMDKKMNLKVLQSLVESFEISSPGQYYRFEEAFGPYKLIFSCQISRGIVIPYIFIHEYGLKLRMRSSLAMLAKEIHPEGESNNLSFKSFEELEEIMKELLSIYEDFKTEFLKRVLPDEYGE